MLSGSSTRRSFVVAAVGTDAATDCYWGPSYWCRSRETARECQQTHYCQDNVWKVRASKKE